MIPDFEVSGKRDREHRGGERFPGEDIAYYNMMEESSKLEIMSSHEFRDRITRIEFNFQIT